jgi:hypothetical protein
VFKNGPPHEDDEEWQSEMFGDFMEVLFDPIGAIEDHWTSRLQHVEECGRM